MRTAVRDMKEVESKVGALLELSHLTTTASFLSDQSSSLLISPTSSSASLLERSANNSRSQLMDSSRNQLIDSSRNQLIELNETLADQNDLLLWVSTIASAHAEQVGRKRGVSGGALDPDPHGCTFS
jgi:hypothetical protein